MKQRPKFAKGKTTNSFQNFLVIRRSRNRMRVFSIKNLNTEGNSVIYRLAFYVSREASPDYSPNSTG